MERKIGEIFEYNGEWYQCLENNSHCCGCDYCDFGELVDCDIIACSSSERNDNKEVYFKKLEKVGDTYEKRVSDDTFSTFQRYKVLKPVILPKKPYIYFNFIDNTIEIEIKQTKEDMEDLDKIKVRDYTKVEELNVMEEKKLNLKPFDLEAAKTGKPVCTRDGRNVRIIAFDAKGDKPIIALVEMGTAETPNNYPIDGKAVSAKESPCDLMMLSEKKEGWAKVRKDINLYDTKEEADRKMIGNDEYVTAKVCWEE